VLIALHKDATSIDHLCAYVQAEVLEFIFTQWKNDHWNDKVWRSLLTCGKIID